MPDIVREEWEQWQKVCQLLRDAHAVTAADLSAPTTARTTEGQRLIAAIREWGNLEAERQRQTGGTTNAL